MRNVERPNVDALCHGLKPVASIEFWRRPCGVCGWVKLEAAGFTANRRLDYTCMAGLIQAIDIKRKMYVEVDDTPFHCLEVEVSRPTARGGQTLVRVKMRNLLTRAVFDRTFKAGDKLKEPDLVRVPASFQYNDGTGWHFMDLETFDTLTLSDDMVGEDAQLLVDNLEVGIQKYNGNPIGMQLPVIVELAVARTEPGTRGDTASGSVTKAATLETGLEVKVPLFVNEGERVKVHTETREFAGRA